MTRFRGLTWDHPRGHDALARAAAATPGLIHWDKQPLEGFESRPIEEICAEYDIVVLDHPHLGDALAADCLQPLDALLSPAMLAAIRARTIGPCFESYVLSGQVWALPLDAAAQVSAGRLDLLPGPMPVSWAGVERLAETERGFVMSLAGPHAFLSLLSICASFDDRFCALENGLFQPRHDDAISLFRRLVRRSHPAWFRCNPIEILDAMTAGAGPTYCPLIFGYVPYARAADQRTAIAFRDAPYLAAGHPPRAVLGGTGLAVTRRCVPDGALLYHLAWLLSPQAQTGLIPDNSGQPSLEAAWTSPAINQTSDFYLNTLETLRHAFVRPRSAGFVPAQNRASQWLRDFAGDPIVSSDAVRAKVNALLNDHT